MKIFVSYHMVAMQQLLSRYSGNVLSCTLGPLQSLQTTESVSESRDS